MNQVAATNCHGEAYLAGFRARAVAVGMVQLIKELSQYGSFGRTAGDRIRNAAANELTVARSVGQTAKDFRERVKTAFSDRKTGLSHE